MATESGADVATYGLAIADLNHDGYPDVAVPRAGFSSVALSDRRKPDP
jgi:hypothetical protein